MSIHLEIKEINTALSTYLLTDMQRMPNPTVFGTSTQFVDLNGQKVDIENFDLKGWKFAVADDEFGIQAVAKALGHGMSATSFKDDCADDYRCWGIRRNKQGFTFFDQPVILLSTEDRSGCRAAWGGLREAEQGLLKRSEDCKWAHDVFFLKPGLTKGGILVQSSKNAAIIRVKKNSTYWVIQFITPVTSEGKAIAGRYEAHFRHAFNWYRKQTLPNEK